MVMVTSEHKIVIGTRGSSLALKQTEMVISALQSQHPNLQFETKIIKTTGDIKCDTPIKEIGGKEAFTRELDAAMLRGEIDIAVHSLKDVPGELDADIKISAVLPREDVCDSLIGVRSLDELVIGATIATSSPRRKAQILKLRPDLLVTEIRGNVQTRIDKIYEAKEADATILACAGLIRLGINNHVNRLSIDDFVPAVGQGIVAITCLNSNDYSHNILQNINNKPAFLAAKIERNLIQSFEGDCHSPIAAYAEIGTDKVKLRSFIASEDCLQSESFVDEIALDEAEEFATKQGYKLRQIFDDFTN